MTYYKPQSKPNFLKEWGLAIAISILVGAYLANLMNPYIVVHG